MELKDTGPKEMAAILQEMGQHYNPRRLAAALQGRQLEVSARALRITYTLGKFIASLAKVSSSKGTPNHPTRAVISRCMSTATAEGDGVAWPGVPLESSTM